MPEDANGLEPVKLSDCLVDSKMVKVYCTSY